MTDQERIYALSQVLLVTLDALETVLDHLGPEFEQQANKIEQVAKSLADGFPGAVPIVTRE